VADFFESYVSIRQHVLIRFGKWREIIAQDLPDDRDLYCNTVAMMHYAKGVAHAALDDVPVAAEQALFREAVKRVPKSRYLHNMPCLQLLAVAEEMLEGEIAYHRGDPDAAFARLRAAIALEDDLPYDEPWGWISRSATRSVRCCWSRTARQKPKRSIARISASAAHSPAPKSARTICGPARARTASSAAARLRRQR